MHLVCIWCVNENNGLGLLWSQRSRSHIHCIMYLESVWVGHNVKSSYIFL